MPSNDILDFEALLAPLSSEQPAGSNLRDDYSPESLYYQIKDARSAARDAERSAVSTEEADSIPSEWRTILSLGPSALSKSSKDLEVVAWLIEALVRVHGFAGLRDGIRLARELVETYWDGMYPEQDEDEYETRLAALAGLNGVDGEGTLINPITLAPLTPVGSHGSFNTWSFKKARGASKKPEEKENSGSPQGGLTLDHVRSSTVGVDPQFFRNVLEDLDIALKELSLLGDALDERAKHQAPSLSGIRNALKEAREIAEFIARDFVGIVLTPQVEATEESAQVEDGGASTDRPVAGSTPVAVDGPISSRNDAFRILANVAEYFRTHEPHSPLPSLIEQAIRWGHMPLEKLMMELIPNPESRTHFARLTGLKTNLDNSDSDS